MDHDTDSRAIEDLTLAEAIELVRRRGIVVLTEQGTPTAALTSIGELTRLRDERELLRRLALGELEAAAGEGDPIEGVLADCRLLLEEN